MQSDSRVSLGTRHRLQVALVTNWVSSLCTLWSLRTTGSKVLVTGECTERPHQTSAQLLDKVQETKKQSYIMMFVVS